MRPTQNYKQIRGDRKNVDLGRGWNVRKNKDKTKVSIKINTASKKPTTTLASMDQRTVCESCQQLGHRSQDCSFTGYSGSGFIALHTPEAEAATGFSTGLCLADKPLLTKDTKVVQTSSRNQAFQGPWSSNQRWA